jgi:hypothetical protein
LGGGLIYYATRSGKQETKKIRSLNSPAPVITSDFNYIAIIRGGKQYKGIKYLSQLKDRAHRLCDSKNKKKRSSNNRDASPWIVEINLLQGCLPLVPTLSAI